MTESTCKCWGQPLCEQHDHFPDTGNCELHAHGNSRVTLAEQLTRMVAEGTPVPDAIEVLVMTANVPGEATLDQVRLVITTVAPMVVAQVHQRIPGRVLMVEPCEGQDEGLPAHWHAVVEDLGPDTGQVIH